MCAYVCMCVSARAHITDSIRCGFMVAMPVGQVPSWHRSTFTQPRASIGPVPKATFEWLGWIKNKKKLPQPIQLSHGGSQIILTFPDICGTYSSVNSKHVYEQITKF